MWFFPQTPLRSQARPQHHYVRQRKRGTDAFQSSTLKNVFPVQREIFKTDALSTINFNISSPAFFPPIPSDGAFEHKFRFLEPILLTMHREYRSRIAYIIWPCCDKRVQFLMQYGHCMDKRKWRENIFRIPALWNCWELGGGYPSTLA